MPLESELSCEALLQSLNDAAIDSPERLKCLKDFRQLIKRRDEPLSSQALTVLARCSSRGLVTQRKLASTCLLQAVSVAPTALLKADVATVVRQVILGLNDASVEPALGTAALQIFQTAATLLRVLSVIWSKLASAACVDVPEQLAHIHFWAFIGSRLPGAPPRVQAFRQPGLGVSEPRRASVQTTSESELEGVDVSKQRKEILVQVRLDALSLLSAVIEVDSGKHVRPDWSNLLPSTASRALSPHLFLLLESDVSAAVRIRACQAVRGMLDGSAQYLALAEDRPTKASFTSLSTELAQVVTELHARLSRLVGSPPLEEGVFAEIVKLCRVLVSRTPYARLHPGLLDPVHEAIVAALRDSVSIDHSSKSALADCLEVTTQRLISSRSPDASRHLLATFLYSSSELSSPALGSTLREPYWRVCTAAVSRLSEEQISGAIGLAEEHASQCGAAIGFVSAAATALPNLSAPLDRATRAGLSSSIDAVQQAALGSLVNAAKRDALHCGRDDELLCRILQLVDEKATSDSAVRLLGVTVAQRPLRTDDAEWLSTAVDTLLRLEPVTPSSAGLSWSLANCGDALVELGIERCALSMQVFIERSVGFLAATESDATRVNGARLGGTIVRLVPGLTDGRISDVTRALRTALADGSPKLQWNAATSLGFVLEHSVEDTEDIVSSLCTAIASSKVFKVMIQALQSLRRVPATLQLDHPKVTTALGAARTTLTEWDGYPPKERAHATRLQNELQQITRFLEDHCNAGVG